MLGILLERSYEMTMGLIKEMEEAPFTFPTPNGGCHPMWVLGSLVWNEAMFIREWVQGESNPFADWDEVFGIGTEPTADVEEYPPFSEVLAKAREERNHTLAVLASLGENDLDKASHAPPDRQASFGSYRDCFLMLALKWMMHRGNSADAKRAAGLSRP
jgi:hypothetical protein